MPAELDEITRRVMQLEIERERPAQGDRRGLPGAAGQAREGAGRAAGAGRRRCARSGSARRRPSSSRAQLREQHRGDQGRDRAGRAGLRPEPRGRAAVRHAGRSSSASSRRWRPQAERGGGRRLIKEEVDEEDIAEVVSPLDRHPAWPSCWRARCRSSCTSRRSCTSAWSARTRPCAAVADAVVRARGGIKDPKRPDRLVPLPRPDRRRQDRAGPRAGRAPVRRRGRHDPHRHVRVHGEAHRGAADRRAARLRRLRGGRPAHRGGAPPAVLA